MVVLASNQWPGARALHEAQAVGLIGEGCDIAVELPLAFAALTHGRFLEALSGAASKVTDGLGVVRVLKSLEEGQ